MTLTQLGAFVLVARLGSVRAAADALGVSEPAVSRALAALRQHLGDDLLIRDATGMRLTEGGARLFPLAAQMVALGADAQAAVLTAKGAPAPLRLLVTSTISEFIATPLAEAFGRRHAHDFDLVPGVASTTEMRVLLSHRLADAALGPNLGAGPDSGLASSPVLRYRLVVVGSPRTAPTGPPARWPWLVDPSGTDPDSDAGRLLRRLRIPENRVRVFPNQTAAWAAAADGAGVAPAVATLVGPQLRRAELRLVDTGLPPLESCWYLSALAGDSRPASARYLQNLLAAPATMRLMCAPGAGVPPSRFRPPVYVTIWS